MRPLLIASAALLLVAVPPAQPASAGTDPPLLTLAQAVAALPAADLPPGDVTTVTESTVARPTEVHPCTLSAGHAVPLLDTGAAIGQYATAANSSVFTLAQWVVSVRVFAGAAPAHAAVARLGLAERACPVRSTAKNAAGRTSIDRTWSGRIVTPGGWHGYHTVDVLTISARRYGLRHIAVYLQRGNVLIQVDEVATVAGHNSGQQESRRLAVQEALESRVTAELAASSG